MSKSRRMPYNPAHLPCKWRNTDINKVQSWASYDLNPTSPKPSFPTRRLGSRILRGYYGAREFVASAHLTMGPKIRAEENSLRGHIVRVQKRPKNMAEDDIMLGTSQNVWRKWQTQYRGSTREKAANTVVWNPASDRPILQTMLFNFSQPPPIAPRYGLIGRICIPKSKTYTWTLNGR